MSTFRLRLIDLFNPKQILSFLWLFLLVFPKGGVKIGEIPLTWGYLLLGIFAFFVSLRKSWKIQMVRLEALLCLIPFLMIVAFTMLFNGVGSIAWTVSFFITFFFLPCVFLFVFSRDIENMDLNFFYNLLKKGVVFVSYYGIFLFVYRQAMGKYIEIPFLTVNWGDLGTLDTIKFNNRGIVNKLISTYNNGQLFGVSMILLLPLYCYVQKNFWHKLAIKIALILTLSRTTWIGLLFHEIFYNLIIMENKKKGLKNLSIMFLFLLGGIIFITSYYRLNLSFFLDASLGGRRYHLETLQNISIFSDKVFFCISEMVYLSILDTFGVAGLLGYLVAMVGPILYSLSTSFSRIHLCILLGLVNYLFISFSDGAALYIPVLAFFWFLVSLLGRKNLDEPLDKKAHFFSKRSNIPLRCVRD